MRIEATTVADYDRIRVEPITGAIGAEVSGVDLRELDDELISELRRAWLDHKVLFFHGQELTQAQHVAYGRAFGELEIHPFIDAPDGHPEIVVLESTPERFEAAEFWHNDVTFRPTPPMGSILLGRRVPPYGGDTAFADMELAYELLDDRTKELLADATAVHSHVKTFGGGLSQEELAEARRENPEQTHPVVRTHPETGRKALFVNRPFTMSMQVPGLDPDETRALRHRLYEQARIPEIQCRFRWRPGSIAQWDNRCAQHYAIPDYGGFSRRMERVTLVGDRPF